MKQRWKVLLLSILFLFATSVPAMASGVEGSLVPQDSRSHIGDVHLKYTEYPQSHYHLDTYYQDTGSAWWPGNWDEKIGQQMYAALGTITNGLWTLNVTLSNFAGLIVQQAFTLDIVGNVIDQIAAAIQSIAGFDGQFAGVGLWPMLLTFIIVLVGTWAAYVGILKRETSRALGGLLSSMIVFALALGLFAYAGKFLHAANDWSSGLQSNILNISSSIITPGKSYSQDEGIAAIRNQIFSIMVFKPYLIMQYGTADKSEIKAKNPKRINDILSVNPNSDERQALVSHEVQKYDNEMMSINGITKRAAYVPLVFIANAILGVMLLLLAGAVLLYQIIFIALVLIAPVPLLIALIPRWQQTAINWGLKTLHALLMKIGIALLLTILFAISSILYRATDDSNLGYLGVVLVQIICFVGIWVKRHDLFAVVSTATNHVQSHARDLTSHHRYKEHARTAQNTARKARTAAAFMVGRGSAANGRNNLAKRQPLNQKNGSSNGYGVQGEQGEGRDRQNKQRSNGGFAARRLPLAQRSTFQEQPGGEGTEKDSRSSEEAPNVAHLSAYRGKKPDSVVGVVDRPQQENREGSEPNERPKTPTGQKGKRYALAKRPSMDDIQQSKKETAASSESSTTDRQQLNQHHRQEQDVKEKQKRKLVDRRTLDQETQQEQHNDNRQHHMKQVVDRHKTSNETNRQNTREVVNRENVHHQQQTTHETNRERSQQIVNREDVSQSQNVQRQWNVESRVDGQDSRIRDLEERLEREAQQRSGPRGKR